MRRTIEVSLSDSGLHFYFSTRHLEKTYEADPVLVEFVRRLNGNRTVDQLLRDVQALFPSTPISPNEVQNALAALVEDELIEDAAAPPIRSISQQDLARFDRQLSFFEDMTDRERAFDTQDRLRKARVSILGIGGMGSWIAMTLSMCGAGELVICDCDIIQESNLTRQGAYRITDIGHPKVEALADQLMRLSSGVQVETHRVRIDDETDLTPFLEGASFAISCIDEPDTATAGLWLSKAALRMGIPHQVGGGYNGHLGLVSPTIIPGTTGCWNCFLMSQSEPSRRIIDIPGLSPKTGTVAPVTAIIANLHAWEAIRVITGIAPPLMANRKLELDLNSLESTWSEFERRPDCPLCGHL